MKKDQWAYHLMNRYTVDHLKNDISPAGFEENIRGMIGEENWKEEGYPSSEGQRMPSIKFYWGHNHDFGSFHLKGKMDDRHIRILTWAAENGMSTDLSNKRVLDIGCWTGGMSLLLYAMGEPYLVVIEEVRKYARAVEYLRKSFGLKNMTVIPKSLYELHPTVGSFDLINFSGVLYHITDPVVALQIISSLLKIGGMLILETAVHVSKAPILYYQGPGLNKDWAWNWFFPSMPFIEQALKDVGIEISVSKVGGRVMLIGIKTVDKPYMWCGATKRI